MTASDVLILTSSSFPSSSDEVLKGLKASGLPVTVVEEGDTQGREDLATHSHTTAVYTSSSYTRGLERPVVVWLEQYRRSRSTQGDGQSRITDEEYGRLHAMSRCTAQLINVLIMPPGSTS